MNRPSPKSIDARRLSLLVVSAVILIAAVASWWFKLGGPDDLPAQMLGRIGIVLAALWLAWPSLKRPAMWLPAGAPVIGIVALIVVAAQPRLLLPAIPMVAVLISLSAIVRAFRKPS